MNKGMFYLLPFLVLTPVAASSALTQVKIASFLNVIEDVRTSEKPKATLATPNPVSGRNINGRHVIKVLKPRAGRNASRLRGRLLIKRK